MCFSRFPVMNSEVEVRLVMDSGHLDSDKLGLDSCLRLDYNTCVTMILSKTLAATFMLENARKKAKNNEKKQGQKVKQEMQNCVQRIFGTV